MKKQFLGLFLLAAIPVSLSAQNVVQDASIRQGKLKNGLTYYIRHNAKEAGLADFYIAQAGSRQRVDQLYLVGNADGLGFILQTVAWADFDKAYMGGEGHGVRPVLIVRRTL